MHNCTAATIAGYNSFIREQKAAQPDAKFTLNMFDNEHIISRYTMKDVPELTHTTYIPRNDTALYDAVGLAVGTVHSNPTDRYLVVILTDGLENASRTWKKHEIATMIQNLEALGNWTFVYMGSDHNAFNVTRDLGIARGNTMQYAKADTQPMFASVSQSTYSFGTSGRSATKTFFTTDLSKLAKGDVNRLRNLSGQVKQWTVEKEVEIQPFVEAKGIRYNPGSAFYQLTKKENITPHKEIMIVEKGTKVVYGGKDARDQLGIPQGVELKVTPGNHSNWDIFVQSHSTNRKLVRGTKLIYKVV
jgi:hypothetical protein